MILILLFYIVTRENQTLSEIAQEVYGDPTLGDLIADANGYAGVASFSLQPGENLIIPNRVANIHNTADSFIPYDPARIIGDTTPYVPMPIIHIIKQHHKSGWLGMLVEMAVSGFLLWELMPVMGTSLLGFFEAGAEAGAAGNLAGQLTNMATGAQHGFDIKGLVESTLISGATAWAGGYMGGGAKAPQTVANIGMTEGEKAAEKAVTQLHQFVHALQTAALKNLASQGIHFALHPEAHLSWQSMLMDLASGGIDQQAGINPQFEKGEAFTADAVEKYVVNTVEADIVQAGLSQAIYHDPNLESLAISSFGKALGETTAAGNYVPAKIAPTGTTAQPQQNQRKKSNMAALPSADTPNGTAPTASISARTKTEAENRRLFKQDEPCVIGSIVIATGRSIAIAEEGDE